MRVMKVGMEKKGLIRKISRREFLTDLMTGCEV